MAYYVGLNIFVAPNANSSNNRINDMFLGAQEYWRQHGIILEWFWHYFPDADPQYYWWAYTNEEYFAKDFDYTDPDTLQNLLPYTEIANNNWIGVFFVGGNKLKDGKSTGLAQYRTISQNNKTIDFQANIVVTDEATPLVLAHEIGHVLFARIEGNNVDSKAPCCPNDPGGHSNVKNDLMLPTVPSIPNPILTKEEIEKALQSPKAFYVPDK